MGIISHNKQRGFTLLIAVIFTSVILAFAVALGSLGYKQSVLSSASLQSTSAFYAADAALECALYADQQQQLFDYSTFNAASPVLFSCGGAAGSKLSACKDTGACTAGKNQLSERVSLDSGTHCADVTIYKTSAGTNNYIYSVGYNVSCAIVAAPGNIRFVARGLQAHY